MNLNGWTLSDRDGNRDRFDDVRLSGRATAASYRTCDDTRTDVDQVVAADYIWGNVSDKATSRRPWLDRRDQVLGP